MPSRLEVTNLHSYYGDSHVLQGCSLTVEAECTCVLGRNGMGKTTLMRSIMGLTPPRNGTVTLNGKDFTRAKPERVAQAGIGYVPQGRHLFPSLNVEEHLTLFHRNGKPSPGRAGSSGWTPRRVLELFPELANRRKVSGTLLSGGEQQMLTMGRALVTNPSLLILDEPSEGLAPVAVDRVVETCRELLRDGMSLLLVEQNIHVAAALADRVYVLVSGRTVHQSVASEFFGDQKLRQTLLGL